MCHNVSQEAFLYYRQRRSTPDVPTSDDIQALQAIQSKALRQADGLEPVTDESQFEDIQLIEALWFNKANQTWEVRRQPFGKRRQAA